MSLPEYTIVPINCGMLQGVDQGNLTAKRRMGEKTEVPTVMFVVIGHDEVIILDTGPGEPEEVKVNFDRILLRPNGESPIHALQRLGISPSSVKHVVASHLHWDHAGALDLFPNAKIYVQKREVHWAMTPPPLENDIYELHAHKKTLPRWLKSYRSFKIIDGDMMLMPGIDLILLPGHTPGMMGMAVNTAAGRYLIASDAVPVRANLLENVPPGWFCNIEDVYRTYDKIRALADVDHVLMGHEVALFDQPRYPS